ncbi:MAG: hypothetical protein U0031_17395 [Thermomicrobiales bacterium]
MEGQFISAILVVCGLLLIVVASGLAIRTFMIPTGAPPLINRFVFRLTQAIFDILTRVARSEERRQHILSPYAPCPCSSSSAASSS